MLDLYHGQIQKDDVILCNTGNPLITEASDLFRGTSNQKRAARSERFIPLRVTPRSFSTSRAVNVGRGGRERREKKKKGV